MPPVEVPAFGGVELKFELRLVTVSRVDVEVLALGGVELKYVPLIRLGWHVEGRSPRIYAGWT